MNFDLASRFEALWIRCAGRESNSYAVWEYLRQHYAQEHRYYHTLEHVNHCLHELDSAGGLIDDRDAVELALWFHDVICEPDRNDNEAASADYFRNAASSQIARDLVDEVCEMILATAHVELSCIGAKAYVVDIDLSSFGLPWEDYLRDSNALRKEQAGVPDEEFYRSKLRFFGALSARPAIFQTDFFRERHEKAARDNIDRYSAIIKKWGFGGGEDSSGG